MITKQHIQEAERLLESLYNIFARTNSPKVYCMCEAAKIRLNRRRRKFVQQGNYVDFNTLCDYLFS